MAHWQSSDWKKAIRDLHAEGVDDHVVLQWTIDSYDKIAYYPATFEGYKRADDKRDAVGKCLRQAKKNGTKVWLGLNWNKSWHKLYTRDKSWMEGEFDIARQVADELWRMYGQRYGNVIAGFYVPMDVNNVNYDSSESQDRIKLAYKAITEHIHSKMQKPVMVSPVCKDGEVMGQVKWQAMWENILTEASIDVINIQDGVGASRDGKNTFTTVKTVASWFDATHKAIEKVRPATQLWANLETFEVDGNGNYVPLKNPSRLLEQIKAVQPHVVRITSFSQIHYPAALRSAFHR